MREPGSPDEGLAADSPSAVPSAAPAADGSADPASFLDLRFFFPNTRSPLRAALSWYCRKNRSEYMDRADAGQGSSPRPARLSTPGTLRSGPPVNPLADRPQKGGSSISGPVG